LTPTEIRPATLASETREDGAPVLTGYAAMYDTPTVVAGLFREQIARGAFDEAVARDDVRALFNHNPDVVLGRTTSGTLRLTTDAVGLRYEVTLNPADAEHQRVWQMVSRGDVTQSSFGFEVRGQQWGDRSATELPLRTITKVALYDVSPVTYPAYATTTVTARDLPGAAADAPAVQQAAHEAAAARVSLVQALRRRLGWSDD
jgi:HK97 family phage prohead protease